MKHNSNYRSACVLRTTAILALCGMVSAASAQSLYWDLNGPIAGSGGPAPAGAWDAASALWNESSAGTGAASLWVDGRTAVFSAATDATGTYAVSIAGAPLVGGLSFEDGNVVFSGAALSLAGGANVVVAAGRSATIGVELGGGAWGFSGAGWLTLANANTFTGPVSMTSGRLQLDHDYALGTAALNITPASSVFVQNTVPNSTLTNAIQLSLGAGNVDVSALFGILTLNGPILGNQTLWTVGGQAANTVILGGNNAFVGNLQVVGGTLIASRNNALGDVGGNTRVNAGTTLGFQGDIIYSAGEIIKLYGDGVAGQGAIRNVTGNNIFYGQIDLQSNASIGATAGTLELAGSILGASRDLRKVGTGRIVLSGLANDFNATTVAEGSLEVKTSIGSGPVTVETGATLTGSGDISGSVALLGNLDPATGTGTISTGPQTWEGGASYTWDINNADFGLAGDIVGWDLIDINGALTINATAANKVSIKISSLDLSNVPGDAWDFDSAGEYSFEILRASGGITGFDPASFAVDTSAFSNPIGNGIFLLEQSGNSLFLRYLQQPAIVGAPQNQTVMECHDGTFSVAATGTAPLSYQWYFGAAPIAGATTASLTLTGVTPANAGSYSVVVSNETGVTVTSAATLAVNNPVPVISGCPGTIIVQTGPGRSTCDQVATWTAPIATDNCPGVTLSSDHNPGDLFPVGDTLVTYVAMDQKKSQLTSCSFIVRVQDTTMPQITGTPANITISTGPDRATCDQVVTWTAPTATDNCPGVSLTSSHAPGATFALGTTAVTYTATDAAGNTTTSSFTVTVQDTTLPVISGLADITVTTGSESSNCDVTATWTAPTVTDNCTVSSVTSTHNSGDTFSAGTTVVSYTATDASGNTTIATFNVIVQDTTPPVAGCKPFTIVLDSTGQASLSPADVFDPATSSDNCGSVEFASLSQTNLTFCDIGEKAILVSVRDTAGNIGTCTATVTVQAPVEAPAVVYVDPAYGSTCAEVTFPHVGGSGNYYVGQNAFASLQAALAAVAPGGTVRVAAGEYVANLTVAQSVTLLGPNAGKAGSDLSRGDEAIIRPAGYEPENTPIISVEADDVTIDGFVLDGFNSEFLTGDYDANGVRVGAAAGVQNGVYPEVVDITGIKIQNNVIRNVSYDGVYLELSLGFDNGFNYIRSNRFENMWEGLQTYAVHSVISDNTFLSCNWGMSLHGTITPAPAGFTPLIASNTLTIAEWWPDTDLPRTNSQAIWINYRRAQAAELDVVGNVINTPVAAPAGRNIRGLYALTVDGGAKVNFIGNTVNGFNNCTHGVYAVGCLPDGAVKVLGGSLLGIKGVGVLARTFDPVWYAAADTYITVSNTTIMTITGGTGIMVHQPVTTPLSKARVTVLDDTTVTGGTVGVRVQGTNAAASIINNSASISGNTIGIYVDGGRAMVERNNLTANTSAGIVAMMGGIVDAGDCTGANITGLGTGSGLNGSSAGLNVLTSYGFDGISPYAVQNNGGVVRAHQNSFGATPVNDISRLMFGVVTYSQAGGLLASCPAPVTVQCVGSIPAGAVTLAQFKALGGNVSCNPATISYVDSPAAPPQGDTVVTRVYTLTDACGTSTSCAQTITVQDSTAPLITAPAAVTLNTDAGSCFVATATVNLGTPVTSDNCGVASVTHNAPAQLPVGQTTVTWTVQDVNGLEATATQVVTVVDYQPPTLVAPAQIVVPTDAGSCFATAVNLGTPTAADNCAAPSLSNNAPAQFPKGATTVTWTATDVNGLTATATQLVVVEDQELPSITLPADVTILNTDSTKPYFTGRATATDNCGQVTVSYTETAYLTNCNATGVIRREWKAQDDADNLALGTQVITIIDSTAPVFASLPANITVDNDVSNCAAVVTFPNLVAVDYAYNQGFENEGFESNTNGTSLDWNDALSHLDRVLSGTDGLTSRSGAAHGLIYSSASLPFKGAFTRMGGSSLTFSKGFKNSLDVYLDIDDFTVAEQTYGFSLSALVNNQQAAPLRSFAFHAASDVNGHILIAADKTPATARREDLASVDHHAVTASGWYTFEWVCRDNAGVLAVDCNLRDASGSLVWTQTLSNPADLIASAVGGNGPVSFNFITPIKLAIDNTRIERFASVDTSVASGTSFPVGTTSVTCTATDACGNSTDTTFTVTVTDNQAPVVECPANIVQATDPDQCGAVVNYTVPAWDNCGIATVVMTPVSGTFLPVGTTQVSVLATDIHGNSQTCSFDVTVADLQAPVLTCPADIVRMVPSDADFASVVFSTPQASDNCGLYNISVSPGSGSGFPLGTNAVVVTAWDTAGNLVSCTFNVAVVRTEGTPIVNVVDYSNNTAAVQVTGYQGLSVVLQASTNLVNWVDIRTNTAPFVHVDAQSTTIPSRFYRAVYKP